MRGSIVLGGLLLAAVSLTGVGAPAPAAQVDLFLAAAVDARALARIAGDAARDGVAAATAELGAARLHAMLPPTSGAAMAGDEPERRVLRAVEVTTVAPDRVRIRVAAQDMLAGHAVADSVATSLAASGLRERLRLSSDTRGGGMAGVVWAVLGVSLVLLVGRAVGDAVRRSNGTREG